MAISKEMNTSGMQVTEAGQPIVKVMGIEDRLAFEFCLTQFTNCDLGKVIYSPKASVFSSVVYVK